jgi:hypothetical protein
VTARQRINRLFEAENPTLAHLKQVAEMQASIGHKRGLEQFVLDHGMPFDKVASGPVKRGTPKACFMNACHLAFEDDALTYVEGYACGVKDIALPMQHAWCVNAADEVIDPTWPRGSGYGYYGVPFDTRFLRQQVAKRGYYGLIDDWEHRWPLPTGKIKPDRFMAARFKKPVAPEPSVPAV